MKESENKLKALFLLAQQGEQGAYREFLEGTSLLLRGYLLRTMNPRLRSVEQVEDLVQEILLAIHRKRDLYQADRPLLPWIYAIARYRFIDSLRAQARQPECVEWIEKFDAVAFVEIPKLLEEEDGEELMKGLNDRQKEILRLAKVEELSLSEIATRYGMSISAVKVTIHRSLKSIRKRWEGAS
jgi:RNA polymerase sigma-70 factor (ECF subfamily)